MDWSGIFAAVGVIAAIVTAGFAVGRNEWNKTTMERYHTANDELRSDNDDLREKMADMRAEISSLVESVQAEHENCEQRLADEVQKWAQKVGHLEGQMEAIQTEVVQTFVKAIQTEVIGAVQNGVEEGVDTALKRRRGTAR